MTAGWRPLLEGEAKEQAEAAIDAIASDLAAQASNAADASNASNTAGEPGSSRDLSLAGGLAGRALFFSYLHFARPGEGHDDTAMALLEKAIEGTAEMPVGAGLYGGFAGVAWTLEHLADRLFDTDGEDPGEEIAKVLADYLGTPPWQGDYDLIGGLVGFGVYALERLPRPGGRECLAAVVARLAETSERRPEGISWHTPSERTGPIQQDLYPEGHYNLGVAHGVPGVIAVLGEALAAGLPAGTQEEAKRLLAGSFDWVLSQRLDPGAGSLFPYNFAPGIAPSPTRLAWCYGDLGVAISLLLAAAPTQAEEALAIARQAAARPVAGAGVVDAGLCHGAAGNGHLFNRLYQATGDASLAAAARTWFGEAFALRRPGEGVGGYQAWLPVTYETSAELGWRPDPGFLTGAAGVGLALLAATTPVEPLWDRVLLTAIPPSLP